MTAPPARCRRVAALTGVDRRGGARAYKTLEQRPVTMPGMDPGVPQGEECLLCDPAAADAALDRPEVWADGTWRLTMALRSELLGFSYLEPRRHVPHIEDLDGEEARTFGQALALAAALKQQTGAELVFLYVFGEGIPHLHLHLAPHRAGDALNTQILRGEFVERPLPGGATEYLSSDFPLLEESELRDLAGRVHRQLHGASTGRRAAEGSS
jgi:diadenosine tetraphosphate (Ap4A) HIT family hydrolase